MYYCLCAQNKITSDPKLCVYIRVYICIHTLHVKRLKTNIHTQKCVYMHMHYYVCAQKKISSVPKLIVYIRVYTRV